MEKSVITFLTEKEKEIAKEITKEYFGIPNIARGYSYLLRLKAKEMGIEI